MRGARLLGAVWGRGRVGAHAAPPASCVPLGPAPEHPGIMSWAPAGGVTSGPCATPRATPWLPAGRDAPRRHPPPSSARVWPPLPSRARGHAARRHAASCARRAGPEACDPQPHRADPGGLQAGWALAAVARPAGHGGGGPLGCRQAGHAEGLASGRLRRALRKCLPPGAFFFFF